MARSLLRRRLAFELLQVVANVLIERHEVS
jgi:hypothetical protein